MFIIFCINDESLTPYRILVKNMHAQQRCCGEVGNAIVKNRKKKHIGLPVDHS
jgi:hypothetical protein